jgi:transglutaminase-like putative cysteine protease
MLLLAAGLGFGAHRGLGELQAKLEDWISDWYASGLAADPYKTSTDLGSVGRLKMVESIVLRVYADRELAERLRLLHRASFTALHGRTWVARGAPMAPLRPLDDGTTWPLAEGEASHRARIITNLERGKALLALPQDTVRISAMPAATAKHNALGAVEVEFGGDWAPYVVELGARSDYAVPGPEDLQMPVLERELRSVAEELGLRPGMPPAEALRRVREHLGGFTYSTFRESDVPLGSTALGDFLRRTKSGHCEYFAGAATLLLRAAGVPARYATGFAMVEYSALEEAWVVRARHAHAWTRAWVDGAWIDVDTTPPSWIDEEAGASPAWQKLADFLRWTGFRWSQRGPLQGGPGWYALLAALFALFAWRVLRGKRSAATARSTASVAIARNGADSEFFELERRLGARFAPRLAAESPGKWLGRLALDPSIKAGLEKLLELHCRYRFDPAGITAKERGELRSGCAALGASLD